MPCQSPPVSALASYARSLRTRCPEAEASPMLLPMYTVPVRDLLDMAEMEPHEELKAKGLLVVFQRSLGNAAFVSHQWVGHEHPDPEFKQMRVLQAALKYAMSSSLKHIPLDIVTELLLPGAKDMPTSELVEKDLFIWYDYFSCPQLERKPKEGERSELSKAIESIPAYVAASAFFFVLCPVIENEHLSKEKQYPFAAFVCDIVQFGDCNAFNCFAWSKLLVRILRLISCPSASMGSGPPGQGEFSLAEDRKKVEELLLQTGGRGLDMTLALNESLTHHGGSAELVKRLLDLRADVNDQTFTWWKPGFGMGLIAMQKNLQHKCGKRTLCSKLMYHGGHGGTPLMLAMLTYQYEAAACLIAEGARLDSRNSRGWTAKDFAAGQPVPDFLLEAFEGSSEGCCRVTSIALRNACVEL
ncbi:unnamed protein product [Durusdinium trenchii]|uniref:Uncharacterized protein n=1 Tax=Durusdinium trenchii TaxID=1381693 RepID=A0ABP0LW70_9DINO